jgi:hypothetical protein
MDMVLIECGLFAVTAFQFLGHWHRAHSRAFLYRRLSVSRHQPFLFFKAKSLGSAVFYSELQHRRTSWATKSDRSQNQSAAGIRRLAHVCVFAS